MVRAAVAPLVLLVVLVTHVSARWSADLTPWKGGGFGMFSTVDSPASRAVRVELETDMGALLVAVPSDLEDLVTSAKAAPSTGRLVRLAEALAEQWWVVPDLASLADSTLPDDLADEDLRSLAVEALTHVVPADTVQAVDPARFDAATQRRLEVHGVTVVVLHIDARADAPAGAGPGPLLQPEPIRAVTLDLVPPGEEETP
jgi:hypothetical protein